jgi:hypothetical protein
MLWGNVTVREQEIRVGSIRVRRRGISLILVGGVEKFSQGYYRSLPILGVRNGEINRIKSLLFLIVQGLY